MFHLNPITVRRLRRFKRHRRAFWSLVCLLVLYGVSLCSELLCNSVPLMMRHNGKLYFPVFRFYPDNEFTGSGLNTRPDYRKLQKSPEFAENGSWMLWPLIATGPNDILSPYELSDSLRVNCRLEPVPMVCGVSLDRDGAVTRFQGAENLIGEANWKGGRLEDFWELPDALSRQIKLRFDNESAQPFSVECKGRGEVPSATVSLLAYSKRTRPPREVRLTVRVDDGSAKAYSWLFEQNGVTPIRKAEEFAALESTVRDQLLTAVHDSSAGPQSGNLTLAGRAYSYSVERESVRFPFRPVRRHWFGLDNAGRDILVRLLYALRTSLSFGLILVVCSMTVGSLLGLTQGYLGGWIDLGGQRLIEIWSALPFLYIVILMGSIYGPGFWLMIFCYALFNWIGISYYMRAEMLRLRKLAFVEAARCLGLPAWRIVLKHVLPNALVPIITFFPFSLVGAIGSLAALDYLGFGLPPPTASIGQLLQQAQSQRWAWWLILYPSATLFLVMLLGVFVGEGVRDAFDPRTQGRME